MAVDKYENLAVTAPRGPAGESCVLVYDRMGTPVGQLMRGKLVGEKFSELPVMEAQLDQVRMQSLIPTNTAFISCRNQFTTSTVFKHSMQKKL